MVDNWPGFVQLVLASLPAAVVMIFFGALTVSGTAVLTTALVVAVGGAMLVGLFAYRSFLTMKAQSGVNRPFAVSIVPATIFLIVPVVAILLVVVLSPQTNLLLPRCIAMVTPLMLLLVAHAVDQVLTNGRAGKQSIFTLGISGAIVAVSAVANLSFNRRGQTCVR